MKLSKSCGDLIGKRLNTRKASLSEKEQFLFAASFNCLADEKKITISLFSLLAFSSCSGKGRTSIQQTLKSGGLTERKAIGHDKNLGILLVGSAIG